MGEPQLKTYSIEEYLALEEQAEFKNEYRNGEVVAMSGGTLNHGLIGSNINALLNPAAAKHNCIAFNNDVRLYIDSANSFVYPDAMVICGNIETSTHDKNAVINPVLVVEVLSKSTESYDRGEKFRWYRSLPSFQEYVLIDSERPVIDVFYKAGKNDWRLIIQSDINKPVYLRTLGTTISLSDIYRNAQGLAEPQIKLDV